jgi:hypothetical protein
LFSNGRPRYRSCNLNLNVRKGTRKTTEEVQVLVHDAAAVAPTCSRTHAGRGGFDADPLKIRHVFRNYIRLDS